MHAQHACQTGFPRCTRTLGEAYFTARAEKKKKSNIAIRLRVEWNYLIQYSKFWNICAGLEWLVGHCPDVSCAPALACYVITTIP